MNISRKICFSVSLAALISICSVAAHAQPYCAKVKNPISNFPMGANCAQRVELRGGLLSGNAKIYFYDGGLPGGRNIRVDADFINNSEKDAFYSLYVAFFDKSGDLITAAGHTEIFPIKAGKTGNKNLEMAVPKPLLPKVTSYQVILYDAPLTIGKQ